MLDNNEEGPTDEHVSRERDSPPVTEDQSKQLVVCVRDPKAGRNFNTLLHPHEKKGGISTSQCRGS